MTSCDRTAQETRRLEESLRRQLRWIEDDIVIALLRPGPGAESAERRAGPVPAPSSPTAARSARIGMLARLRHWSAGVLRSLSAVFQ